MYKKTKSICNVWQLLILLMLVIGLSLGAPSLALADGSGIEPPIEQPPLPPPPPPSPDGTSATGDVSYWDLFIIAIEEVF